MDLDHILAANRLAMKSDWASVEANKSDQEKGVAAPPFSVPLPDGSTTIALPDPRGAGLGTMSFADCTAGRRSRRKYAAEPISLAELSFLLWASQGVRDVRGHNAFRTIPSAGCRHPLDTLVYARRVDGLGAGLYRYVPVGHSLGLLRPARPVDGAEPGGNGALDLDARFDAGLLEQLWNCAALFVWTAVPYRTEWRYTTASGKLVLLDAGHACQALYGACEALGLGTCAIGAYDQAKLDGALGVDGTDEFAVYAAPVGKPPARP